MSWIETLHQNLGDDSIQISGEQEFFVDIIRNLFRPEVQNNTNNINRENLLINFAFSLT